MTDNYLMDFLNFCESHPTPAANTQLGAEVQTKLWNYDSGKFSSPPLVAQDWSWSERGHGLGTAIQEPPAELAKNHVL